MSNDQKKGAPSAPTAHSQLAGHYAAMAAHQQGFNTALMQQGLHAAPPSYDQAMAHPTAAQQAQAQQQAQQAWMNQATYQNYQAAAAAAQAAQAAQSYQQLQAATGYPAAYAPTAFYSPNAHHMYQQQQQHQAHTIVMPNVAAFDGSARFNGISQPVVPPPPPGVGANAAQVAAMQGHNVTVAQKKGNFWTGSTTGGGMTFW